MNISIDTTPLENGNAHRGVGRYTKELLQALQAFAPMHTFLSSVQSESKTKVDIVHYPFFDLFFPTLPVFRKAKTVVTIHDVVPLLFPEGYPVGIKGWLGYLHQFLALRFVDCVVTDSNASKRDIVSHLWLSEKKVHVVYLAASKEMVRQSKKICEKVRKKYSLPKEYLLYVGDINYNKNLPFLIASLQHFPDMILVLVGKNTTKRDIPEGKAITHAIAQHGVERQVVCLDSVDSSTELSALYTDCLAYVQPSLYEGFGLPVLEALQCGSVVLSANTGALPEVGGDAVVYFDPRNSDTIRRAIEKVQKLSPIDREQWKEKAFNQAKKYSWDKSAKEMTTLYESLFA